MNGAKPAKPTPSLNKPIISRLVRCLVPLVVLGASVLTAADDFEPPRLTRPVEPVYPKALKDAGVEGQVETVFYVDRDGSVREPDIVYSTHPEFGDEVTKVLSKWRFAPARRKGRPIDQRVRMPIMFSIEANDPLSKWAGRSVFKKFTQDPVEADEIGLFPEPSAWIEPYYPPQLNGTGKRGEVIVNFVIDEYGDVVNPEVLVGDDPHFIASALAATVGLDFSPHLSESGEPTPVAMAVSYKFDEKKQEQWERAANPEKQKKRKN